MYQIFMQTILHTHEFETDRNLVLCASKQLTLLIKRMNFFNLKVNFRCARIFFTKIETNGAYSITF